MSADAPARFGDRLRAAREKRGLTQAQLAEAAGFYGAPHISALEKSTDVRLSTLRRLMRVLPELSDVALPEARDAD